MLDDSPRPILVELSITRILDKSEGLSITKKFLIFVNYDFIYDWCVKQFKCHIVFIFHKYEERKHQPMSTSHP